MPRAGFKPELRVSVYLNLTHALTHSATTSGFLHMVIVLSFAQFCHLKVKANAASMKTVCKSVCSYCIMMKTVVKIAPSPSQDPHKVRFTNVKTLLSNSLTGTYNMRKKTGIVELGESQPGQIFEQ